VLSYKGASAKRFSRSRPILRYPKFLASWFDLRQLGQSFLPHQKLLQSGLGIAAQRRLDDFGLAPPFRHQSLADDGLQCVVTWSNSLLLPQERDQFREDEGRPYTAPDSLSGSFREQRHELLRPRAVAEQPQNSLRCM